MTIHEGDKLIITRNTKTIHSELLEPGQIVKATASCQANGKPEGVPIGWYSHGRWHSTNIPADAYELIELKYIPLYRLLYE